MNVDEALIVVEQEFLSRELSPIERLVFRASWIGQTYTDIALDSAYGLDYIKEIGSKLWNDLSDALGQRVTKKNLHLVLKQYGQNSTAKSNSRMGQVSPREQIARQDSLSSFPQAEIEFPGRPVPLDSSLYINRPPIEELACYEIHKPGCVLRIKAPRKMGKSSLLNRIMAHATTEGYKTVVLDFQEADTAVFTSINKFLRWFCANVSRQLQLTPKLNDYWDEDLGSKMSCKIYFEGYLLKSINSALVLALNEVNRIFEYPEIAQDFLPMLRAWHEQAVQVETWRKLRLVVVHSTEVYLPLKLTQSPFNIGLPLKVPEFSLEQVQQLAMRYELTWAEGEAGMRRLVPLVEMVGGHPYLLSMAFYQLSGKEMTLEELLQKAQEPTGIYSAHLRSLSVMLQEEPELAAAFKRVISSEGSVFVGEVAIYKLESMGLIHLDGDRAKPSCQLYRVYFRNNLKNPNLIDFRLEELEQENVQLQRLSNLDELTQLANRRYFNQYLKTLWQQVEEIPPLSLILCDVDYFKFYNDAYGHLAGDECLQQIANAIRVCVTHPANVVARYGGEEFAVILPQTDAHTAVNVAEEIRAIVKALEIAHDNPDVDGLPDRFVTVSLGVASIKPGSKSSPEMLIAAADEALYQSKRQGRDRVTLHTENT
ncbi:AAA-like domain-containing protein [Argonema galeatum]|uniref:AAA-like domain-containing protein n=1 Tax=Argonema galeatum TaxID=2942762 RepID=UPI0020111151|nr:AAA-like domain-containing protein [Argonema galeatum]MCL1465913.1 AAA-like domain-containing protein [Argonema galeatum A003/A1]